MNIWALLTLAYRAGALVTLGKGVPLLQLRVRKTIAEVNAGTTLIATPKVGYKLRLVDYKIIAIGGNAGAATSLLIRATQGGSGVSLAVIALAALTQSAVNMPGVANNTVLADGASFVANDANTAITAIKDGADFTTATHFDFIMEYAVDEA